VAPRVGPWPRARTCRWREVPRLGRASLRVPHEDWTIFAWETFAALSRIVHSFCISVGMKGVVTVWKISSTPFSENCS